jgi:predicted nucleic acid-binding protein
MKAVFDSDILVDFLDGLEKARDELHKYSERCISIISWIEIMVGARTQEEEKKCRAFLSSFRVISVGEAIADNAYKLRKRRGIKVPDALIWATAIQENCILVTRNKKDFPASDPGVRIPYDVK